MRFLVLLFSSIWFSFFANHSWAKSKAEISEAFAKEIFSRYEKLRESTLARLVNLENRIDGMSPDFRELLGDRKKPYQTDFNKTGKALMNPVLHYAIITERKRLENEEPFLKELSRSPLLNKQYARKVASNLLVIEATNLLTTYVEYLDQYNRGERGLNPAARNLASQSEIETKADAEIIKILAATLTAMDYSKEKKATLAYSDPRFTSLNSQESEATKKLIEAGLGPWDKDSLPLVNRDGSPLEKEAEEKRRLKQTKGLVLMLEGLASAFAVANKSLGDEYQYRVLKLNQKIKSQLNQKPTVTEP